jgi:hypothetical protein
LLPGPHSTSVGSDPAKRHAASATAAPACSISRSTEMPPLIAASSAARIAAQVRIGRPIIGRTG